jgi:hypothetical protein
VSNTLRKSLLLAVFAAMTVATRAEAVPFLQLDINGGTYDTADETTVANSATFTLVALLTPTGNPNESLADLLGDTYYISAALTPQVSVAGSFGSFEWAGTTYQATGDMVYGTPPADTNSSDEGGNDILPTHSGFPTFFRQFAVTFSEANRATTYDVETDPGDFQVNAAGGSYYATIEITASLIGASALHFDLYNAAYAQCGTGPQATRPLCNPLDLDFAGEKAPFSHDAQSGPNRLPDPPASVPEPASFLLISLGALGTAAGLRRRRS